MTMLNITTRRVALATGAILSASLAALNVSHIQETEGTLLSPVCLAVLAVALGATVAVPVGVSALSAKRYAAALFLLLGAVAGEGWGQWLSAQRLLSNVEARQQITRTENQPHQIAADRVTSEKAAVAAAESEAAKARNTGGCGKKSICKSWEGKANEARARLRSAETALASIPATKAVNLISERFNIPASLAEVLPAILGSVALSVMAFGFLALGVHKPGRDVVASGDVGTPPGNRAEQVQAFVAAYRAKYGSDPSFSDVRDGLGLPASTASKYRARAIG